MKAMIKVSARSARALWNEEDEVYELHADGTESLIDEVVGAGYWDIERQYGIEGELFGQPYKVGK